jgi:hypothetical protein
MKIVVTLMCVLFMTTAASATTMQPKERGLTKVAWATNCKQYGHANKCRAGWDNRSSSCVCRG